MATGLTSTSERACGNLFICAALHAPQRAASNKPAPQCGPPPPPSRHTPTSQFAAERFREPDSTERNPISPTEGSPRPKTFFAPAHLAQGKGTNLLG